MSEEERSKLKVVICDDSVVVQDLLSGYLEKLDCDVECVGDAEGLLEKLKLKDYDVAFLDVLLPGEDGIFLLKEIKKKKLPIDVLMMSGCAVEETEAKALGAIDYLYKPFDMDKIRGIIDGIKISKAKL